MEDRSEALECLEQFQRLAKEVFDASAEAAAASTEKSAEQTLAAMRSLVECDEKLQARLEALEAKHSTHLRIAGEAAAADACESKIKTLSETLCSAEKSLEAVISSTRNFLESARKAGESAPSAADIVCTAQRIAFTSMLPPYPQPGDCRFRHPWPTEGELRTSRHLFVQTHEDNVQDTSTPALAPALDLKRPRDEEVDTAAAPVTPSAKSPRKKPPSQPVNLGGTMFEGISDDSSEESEESGSD